ncbi:hypothetical protein [Amycolatopsis sp. NPDC059657]|uniref:hypothetical protein n=1 Tax=Amycolatopsis sp. NPDC059657 TaxID=3346899 RepID=UPI00366E551D
MSAVMAAYGQVTTGYWPAVVIGMVLLVILIATTSVTVRRARRRRRATSAAPAAPPTTATSDADAPYPRCRALIAEALIVRERVSGQIDAATYQARMKDVASGGVDHVEH